MIHLHQIITKIICVGFRQNYSGPTGSKNIINNCRKSFNVEYFVLALMYFWPQAKWSDSVVVYKRLQKITSLLVQFQSKLEIWTLYITVLLTAYIFSLPHHYLERERWIQAGVLLCSKLISTDTLLCPASNYSKIIVTKNTGYLSLISPQKRFFT